MSVSIPTSSATDIKELNDFNKTLKIYKPDINDNYEAFIDKIISKLNSKKITIIDLNFKRKGGILEITKFQKKFIIYKYKDDKEHKIDLSIFLSKLYLNDTQTQIYFDLNQNTTFDELLKGKTTESLDISQYLEEQSRIGISRYMPVFKKQTNLRPSNLDYLILASLRKHDYDEKLIKHKLLNLKKGNNQELYLSHIKELINFEIKIAKISLRIKKNKILQQHLLRGTISAFKKGKGLSIQINPIRRSLLSNKDIKISASIQDGFDISIKLTHEEIRKIEEDITKKYERITNEIDRKLMPPPDGS
jgi:hypothetical protein